MNRKTDILTWLLLIVVIPLTVLLGALIFKEKHYAWISLCVAVLSCLPFFYSFERKQSSASELTVLAVLIALSAAGRMIFAFLPAFKPITAITVIAAVWLGKEAGFIVGSLSAVVSNLYFGQGPWTPFQMLAWGLIGFIGGLLGGKLQNKKIPLCIFGVKAGVAYSMLMDVWVTVWEDGSFNPARYAALLLAALPTTASYAVSNVVFLLLLSSPIGEKLERIKKKYGLFTVKSRKSAS